MATPGDTWIRLTERSTPVSPDEAASSFSALAPVTSDFLTRGSGEWQGFALDTGHPAQGIMDRMNWAGKNFHTTEHVEPVMIYDDNGKRVLNKDMGYARLRDMKNGQDITVAMVYDNHPIIDYFRRVSDDMVAGVMDSKRDKSETPFYFYLKRLGNDGLSNKL